MKNLKTLMIMTTLATVCVSLSAFAEISVMPERVQVPPMNLTTSTTASQALQVRRLQRLQQVQQDNKALLKMPPYERAEIMHQRAEEQREAQKKNHGIWHRISTEQMYRNYMQSGSIKYGPDHAPQSRRIPLKKGETLMQGIQNEAWKLSGMKKGEQ